MRQVLNDICMYSTTTEKPFIAEDEIKFVFYIIWKEDVCKKATS